MCLILNDCQEIQSLFKKKKKNKRKEKLGKASKLWISSVLCLSINVSETLIFKNLSP